MKNLKTKIYQYIANRLYDMTESFMDNQQMFDMLIQFGYRLDQLCVEQNIYLD